MAERQTLIANLIDETDVKAKYDRQAKRLLANTAVLAWLLRSCIDEFHDFDVDYITGVSDSETGNILLQQNAF